MKSKLLAAFQTELEGYPWAADKEKLAKFMKVAEETLNGGNLIDRTGPAWHRALKACGLPAKITLEALHGLEA